MTSLIVLGTILLLGLLCRLCWAWVVLDRELDRLEYQEELTKHE